MGQCSGLICLGERGVTPWMHECSKAKEYGMMDSWANYTLSTQGNKFPLLSTSFTHIEFNCSWDFPIRDDALKGDINRSPFLLRSAFKASWSPRFVRLKKRKLVPSVSNSVNAWQITLQVYYLSYYQILRV